MNVKNQIIILHICMLIHAHVHKCMYVCVCVYVYIYIYKDIYTHICTFMNFLEKEDSIIEMMGYLSASVAHRIYYHHHESIEPISCLHWKSVTHEANVNKM
ncbi:Hypothetical predicted protein [Octopus vulgaris]|uniref:Secreted protein n=1 Tax=Octopus vulgaris TaxID=6645 RepID=A0AA36BKW8_OCTVU|nr:Hypothetical predicted protein [Octopus vulgaris]